MKAFFDVFPSLKVKSDLQDYFAKTQIERLTNLQDAGGDLEAGIWGEDP